VLENTWSGLSQSRTDLTDSGYFVCSEEMRSISYNTADDTFTGISVTTFRLDGEEYESKSSITGYVSDESNGITINTSYNIYQESLPYGLYWIDTSVSLTLYEDEDHPGYYLLIGQSSNQTYDDEYVMYSNYPY
jgi:hypothetical protein